MKKLLILFMVLLFASLVYGETVDTTIKEINVSEDYSVYNIFNLTQCYGGAKIRMNEKINQSYHLLDCQKNYNNTDMWLCSCNGQKEINLKIWNKTQPHSFTIYLETYLNEDLNVNSKRTYKFYDVVLTPSEYIDIEEYERFQKIITLIVFVLIILFVGGFVILGLVLLWSKQKEEEIKINPTDEEIDEIINKI